MNDEEKTPRKITHPTDIDTLPLNDPLCVPCTDCGRRYRVSLNILDGRWEEIATREEALCLWCIEKRVKARAIKGLRARVIVYRLDVDTIADYASGEALREAEAKAAGYRDVLAKIDAIPGSPEPWLNSVLRLVRDALKPKAGA